MKVYVINKDGNPLMPCSPRKARLLLRDKKARVVRRTPFTIQLCYQATNYTQPVTLGVDAGSRNIGLSASTKKEELYAAEVELRNDIVKLLSARREARGFRRQRKTRYRKARFLNRVKNKKKGWLAPSVFHKVDTHIQVVNKVCAILPVTKIVVETASFDLQKIKALMENKPLPAGRDYQQGEMSGFWNVREYVLHRDGHICQCCKGKTPAGRKETLQEIENRKILNVHHIESRQTGGDAPANLVTLCEVCHKEYHQGKIRLPKTIKRKASTKDAAFMGIMRWAFYNRLKELYPDVSMTYGYITKNTRIRNNLPKTHCIDALCIAGNMGARFSDEYFLIKKTRCHNRQIHKQKILKGGIRKRNQAPFTVKGFRLFDRVRYKGQECFIFGRRISGYFDLRTLDGTSISKSAKVKDIRLLEKRKRYITERRGRAIPTMVKTTGFSA